MPLPSSLCPTFLQVPFHSASRFSFLWFSCALLNTHSASRGDLSCFFLIPSERAPLSYLRCRVSPLSKISMIALGASQVALAVKNPSASAGDIRDVGLIPESGRSPEGGHSNPLQYSCLKNSMDRGAWQATVHGVLKSWTGLSTHTHTHMIALH